MKLYYVDMPELDKITSYVEGSGAFGKHDAKDSLLDALRLNVLYMVQQAGSGHLGGSLSSLGIMVDLFYNKMGPEDIFITSKGHDAPALYAVLQARGIIPFETIHTLRRPGGLPGHPTIDVPGVLFNTGSLGMGISKANGLAWADRQTPMFYPRTGDTRGRERKIYVLCGDGEMQEGQNWEAIETVYDLNKVIIYVDRNGWQLSRKTPPSGHGIICENTTKGAGISFMENNNQYHAGALTDDEYSAAVQEICARISQVKISETDKISYPRPAKSHELMKQYQHIINNLGQDNKKVVVMDADLEPDCGLSLFKQSYPDRFIQCGIAEQNMVSMATGLSEGGFIPIVHSFAAFLCRRANEQIYNACLEKRHIVFVGAMAGMLPTGPGTSHECLHDIELMKTMPGMTILQPDTQEQLQMAMAWAVNEATGPVYVSIRCWDLEGIRR